MKLVMLRSQILLLVVTVGCSLRGVLSQNPDGPEDCTATIDTSVPNTIIGVPEGTLCVQCVIDGSNATSATFQINNLNVDPSKGIVVDGILIVFNTADVFGNVAISVRCTQGSTVTIFVTVAVYVPPLVDGVSTDGITTDGVLTDDVLTINETDHLVLDCDSINSHNGPPVFWTNSDGVDVSNDRAFEIDNILRNYTGNYTCVTNPPDSENSRSTTIQVIVQYVPDVFADRQELVDVPVNGTLVLSCTLEGVPPPSSVSWRHNLTVVEDSDPRVTIDSTETSTTLMIEGVRDDEGGRYDCVATNVVGGNSARTDVRILLPPGSPTNLRVVPNSQTISSLRISWNDPEFDGFSEVTGFTVEITPTGVDPLPDLPASSTETTLTGLQPLTQYNIRLSAINIAGQGVPAEITGMTLSLDIGPVENLVATALSSTAILLTWEEPVFNAATTDRTNRYRLEFGRVGLGATVIFLDGPTNTSKNFTGLMMGTRYVFTVTPENSVGDGEGDSVTASTNVDPPSAPRNFTGDSPDPFTISVNWTTPKTDGGRDIDRYELTIDATSSPSPVVVTAVDPPPDPYTYDFDGLDQDTTYMISIVAINIDSEDNNRERMSDAVSIDNSTQPVGPPQIPDRPTVSDITNISATISWTDPGGYPDNYNLEVKERVMQWTDNGVIRVDGDSSFLSHPLTGLQPLTNYEARVLSINFNGPSNFSEVLEFATVGMITFQSEDDVNGTIEVTSGATITLTCSLEQTRLSDIDVQYEWSRQDGQELPPGANLVNGQLTIPSAQEEDSGVYICSANGVQGSYILSIMDEPDSTSGPAVSVEVIIIVAVVGGVSLVVFVVVALVAIYCLCFRGDKDGGSPRRTYSFRPKHWAESSGAHSMPRSEQEKRERGTSFNIPDDYTTTTSFNTADRIRRSPSPPRSQPSEATHAGAEPTTSFLLSENTDL